MTNTITPEDLAAHRLWLCGESGGVRLDRRHANLSHANLSGAFLVRFPPDEEDQEPGDTDADYAARQFERLGRKAAPPVPKDDTHA